MVLNPCFGCNGNCCKEFTLTIAKTVNRQIDESIRRSVRKDSRYIKNNFPYIHKRNDGAFICDHYDVNRENGKCSDYENRPFFCKKFICHKALVILELVQESWIRNPNNHKRDKFNILWGFPFFKA